MTTKTSTRNAADLISKRQPFTTSGSLHGEAPVGSLTGWGVTGRLPTEHADALLADHRKGRVTYIVWSYGTPIAWHAVDTGWTVPDVRYTATTGRHQGEVRRAVL